MCLISDEKPSKPNSWCPWRKSNVFTLSLNCQYDSASKIVQTSQKIGFTLFGFSFLFYNVRDRHQKLKVLKMTTKQDSTKDWKNETVTIQRNLETRSDKMQIKSCHFLLYQSSWSKRLFINDVTLWGRG